MKRWSVGVIAVAALMFAGCSTGSRRFYPYDDGWGRYPAYYNSGYPGWGYYPPGYYGADYPYRYRYRNPDYWRGRGAGWHRHHHHRHDGHWHDRHENRDPHREVRRHRHHWDHGDPGDTRVRARMGGSMEQYPVPRHANPHLKSPRPSGRASMGVGPTHRGAQHRGAHHHSAHSGAQRGRPK